MWDFEPVVLKRLQAGADWKALIGQLDLPRSLESKLTPLYLLPRGATSADHRKAYLTAICAGEQHVKGIGPKRRALIRQSAERLGILQPEPDS